MHVTRDLTPQQQFEQRQRRDEWKRKQTELQRVSAATHIQQNATITPSPLPSASQQVGSTHMHTTTTSNNTLAQLVNLTTPSPNNKRTHSQMVNGDDSPNTQALKLKRLNDRTHVPSPDINTMTY